VAARREAKSTRRAAITIYGRHGILPATSPKALFTLLPSTKTVTTIKPAMAATIRRYSTAVCALIASNNFSRPAQPVARSCSLEA
jgi:hypothetical protein